MDLSRSLFVGKLICLAPIQAEQDAEIESRWTHDAEYLSMFASRLVRPLSPFQVKKAYEEIEKPGDEGKNQLYFTIRSLPDERLLGFAKLFSITWSHGTGRVELGIGDPADRRKGYGREALGLLLRYAFEELNLYRLAAVVPEYNAAARHLFEKSGFLLEVCQRQALHRDNRRWDLLRLGLLRSGWKQGEKGVVIGGEA